MELALQAMPVLPYVIGDPVFLDSLLLSKITMSEHSGRPTHFIVFGRQRISSVNFGNQSLAGT